MLRSVYDISSWFHCLSRFLNFFYSSSLVPKFKISIKSVNFQFEKNVWKQWKRRSLDFSFSTFWHLPADPFSPNLTFGFRMWGRADFSRWRNFHFRKWWNGERWKASKPNLLSQSHLEYLNSSKILNIFLTLGCVHKQHEIIWVLTIFSQTNATVA